LRKRPGGRRPISWPTRPFANAVAQKLTIIGEAVARLSPEITARHKSVPWPDIAGLRNILVHEYFGIDWPLVWQTAVDHAPVLREQVAKILGGDSPE